MEKDDLNGRKLKSDIPQLKSARQRYHNKHKEGSGNFGYTLKDKEERWFNLSGNYNENKKITSLRFGSYGQAGHKLNTENLDYKKLVKAINKGLKNN